MFQLRVPRLWLRPLPGHWELEWTNERGLRSRVLVLYWGVVYVRERVRLMYKQLPQLELVKELVRHLRRPKVPQYRHWSPQFSLPYPLPLPFMW